MQRAATLSLVAFLAGAAGVAAEQAGDPASGESYAQQYCAGCHAIANEEMSPELTAPAFRDVANTPGMIGTALAVFLQTDHPTMPNIVIEPDDLDNVIAYILSLKR